MILFYYALGAKSQFHLVVSAFLRSYFLQDMEENMGKKKSVPNEIILQHIYIKHK